MKMSKKLINFRDKALLETLVQKYGDDVVLDQILNAVKGAAAEVSEEVPASEEECCNEEGTLGHLDESLMNCILEFIKKLEGYRLRTREFHWNFDTLGRHKNRDEIMSFLTDSEDAIAEDMMGFFGIRIKPGQIIPVLPKAMDTITMLCELAFDITKMKKCVEGYPECYGISSILDDMMHNCNKYRYLESRIQN